MASPKKSAAERRCFVLDTNVLLYNPRAVHVFDEHDIVIPFTVLGELDKFKKENTEIGRNAREVIRELDKLRVKGSLSSGIKVGSKGGSMRVAFDEGKMPDWAAGGSPDDRIISVAYALKEQGKPVVMISKDINVRLKSDALGIPTEDFENQKVDADQLYTGFAEVVVPGALIDRMHKEKQLPIAELKKFKPLANQFVLLVDALDPSHKSMARRIGDTEFLMPIAGTRKAVYGVLGRNAQQTMALDLLMDDEIKLVTLIGTAGSGKTLLAVAAAMTKTMVEARYDKILVARPIMPMGRDIGYLPGDKDEKLSVWMQPIFDNLSYLMSNRGEPGSGSQQAESRPAEARVKQLLASGQLVMEPLTYIRGRSIPHQFLIIDEAQNLSPHEVKTIVSRVGEGTKIVLTGDIDQIDNPYLDASSNGLSYTIDRMKNQPKVGHVTLIKSERSELASLAAGLL